MTQPRVAIVIINYNYAAYLRQAIDSALAQTMAGCEVIVVDDASTDGSAAVIAGYGDRVVPVLRSVNGGMSAAVNSGFARTTAALALGAGDPNAMYRLMRLLWGTGDDSGARALAKQVGEMHQQFRQQEANRLRYRIEGAQIAAPGNSGAEAPRLP